MLEVTGNCYSITEVKRLEYKWKSKARIIYKILPGAFLIIPGKASVGSVLQRHLSPGTAALMGLSLSSMPPEPLPQLETIVKVLSERCSD